MKKNLLNLLTATIVFVNFTCAQTNLNFENWTGNEPNGWVTSNAITQSNGGAQTVFKESSNPGQGSFSVKMVTGSCPDCPNFSIFGQFGPPTPMPNPFGGGVQLGDFAFPGAPYAFRPISVDFKYKSKPQGNDIGGFQVELTRWNSGTGETETVGEASFQSNAQITSWTNMNIPVIYYTTQMPDTINVFATSSIGSMPDLSGFGIPKPPVPDPVAGSEFYLDAIVINLPSCDGFAISVTGTKESGIGMNDGTASVTPNGGAQPYSYSWSNLATTQSINSLVPGMYSVTVTDANGCQKVGSYFVAIGGCNVSVSVSGTNSSTNNIYTGSGSATANASGGNPPYDYQWNTGATTQTISNLPVGSYAVWVSEQGNPNCGSWGYITVWGPGGPPAIVSENVVENSVLIYPNPANDHVFFTVKDEGAAKILVYDITGKVVMSERISGKITPVSVAELKGGIYFYQIQNDHLKNIRSGKFSVVK